MGFKSYEKDGAGGQTRAQAKTAQGALRREESHVQVRIRTSALNRIMTKYPNIKDINELMRKIAYEAEANNDIGFTTGVLSRTVNSLSQTTHLSGANGEYHFTSRTNHRNGQADDKKGLANKSPNVQPGKAPAYKKRELLKKKQKITK